MGLNVGDGQILHHRDNHIRTLNLEGMGEKIVDRSRYDRMLHHRQVIINP